MFHAYNFPHIYEPNVGWVITHQLSGSDNHFTYPLFTGRVDPKSTIPAPTYRSIRSVHESPRLRGEKIGVLMDTIPVLGGPGGVVTSYLSAFTSLLRRGRRSWRKQPPGVMWWAEFAFWGFGW